MFVNIGFVCLFSKKAAVFNYALMWIIRRTECLDSKLIYYGDCDNITKIRFI